MNEPIENLPSAPTDPTAPVQTTPTEPSGHIDPAAYAAMQRELEESRGVLERLAPHADRIKRLVEDENAAAIFDNTLKAYADLERSKEPQIPDNLKGFDARLAKIEQAAQALLDEREAQRKAPEVERQNKYQQWLNESKTYGNRLLQEHPELNEANGAAWYYLENVAAANDYEPLEKVWKREGHRFVRDSGTPPPPSSLRSEVGDPGIPGPSKQPGSDPNTPIDFRAEFLKRMKSAS